MMIRLARGWASLCQIGRAKGTFGTFVVSQNWSLWKTKTFELLRVLRAVNWPYIWSRNEYYDRWYRAKPVPLIRTFPYSSRLVATLIIVICDLKHLVILYRVPHLMTTIVSRIEAWASNIQAPKNCSASNRGRHLLTTGPVFTRRVIQEVTRLTRCLFNCDAPWWASCDLQLRLHNPKWRVQTEIVTKETLNSVSTKWLPCNFWDQYTQSHHFLLRNLPGNRALYVNI